MTWINYIHEKYKPFKILGGITMSKKIEKLKIKNSTIEFLKDVVETHPTATVDEILELDEVKKFIEEPFKMNKLEKALVSEIVGGILSGLDTDGVRVYVTGSNAYKETVAKLEKSHHPKHTDEEILKKFSDITGIDTEKSKESITACLDGIRLLVDDVLDGIIAIDDNTDINKVLEKYSIFIRTDDADADTNETAMPDPLGDEDEWLNYLYSISNMAKRQELVILRCKLLKAEREQKLKEEAEAKANEETDKAKAEEEAEKAKAKEDAEKARISANAESSVDKDIAKLKERLAGYGNKPKSTDALSSMMTSAHNVVACY